MGLRTTLPASLLAGPQPIEEAYSKIKRLLRQQIGARTREILVEAMGMALDGVTAKDAWGFFAHCGYCILGQ